jgi:exonuclease III
MGTKLSWNVRAMNNRARQEDIKQIMTTFKPYPICVQETKMEDINDSTVRNSLVYDYSSNFVSKPADGTRRGILLAARDPTS